MTSDLTAATVEGGAGPLTGVVTLTGAKNIALKALCLSAMCAGRTTLRNVPANTQNAHTVEILDRLGASTRTEPEEGRGLRVTYDAGAVNRFELDPSDVLRCRHTFLLAIALAARNGHARVPLPGYSLYGPRPVSGQLALLRRFGCDVVGPDDGCVSVTVPAGGLKAATVSLPVPSVAVTDAALLLSVAAKGRSTIIGAARDPETLWLAGYLASCGASIGHAPDGAVTVDSPGHAHLTLPAMARCPEDRLEAAYAAAPVAIRGGRAILNGQPLGMEPVLDAFEACGCVISSDDKSFTIERDPQRPPRPVTLRTGPFPQFPTDVQAALMAVATVADGTSIIEEAVWPNRMLVTAELARLGARISVHGGGRVAAIEGTRDLRAASVTAPDPRGGAALILAALAAHGTTTVHRCDLIDNALAGFVEMLAASYGCAVARVRSSDDRRHPELGMLEAL